MGSNSSKSRNRSEASTPMKCIEEKCEHPKNEESAMPTTITTNVESTTEEFQFDPRSPCIGRTPLSEIIANRLTQLAKADDAKKLPLKVQTPSNLMRKKILCDLGYNYTVKELSLLDPRSPSQFIPRTPLNLKFDEDGEHSKNFQALEYTGIIEEASCRNFNEKLANITLDDSDHEDHSKLEGSDDNEENDAELTAIRQKYLKPNIDFDGEDIVLRNDPRSPSDHVFRTPIIFPGTSKVQSTTDGITDTPNGNHEICKENLAKPMFSSTPTAITAAETEANVVVHNNNVNKMHKAKIYEDEDENNEDSDTKETYGEQHTFNKQLEALLITPVRNLNKLTDDNKARTPLSVINRRTASAENLTQRQSRFKAGDENNKLTALKNRANFVNDENCTPQRPPMTGKYAKNVLRSTGSKIPIYKK